MPPKEKIANPVITEARKSGLIELGVRPHVAELIAYLSQVKNADVLKISKETSLRQSSISIGVKALRDQGYLKSRRLKGPMGYPRDYYRLVVPYDQIYLELAQRRKDLPAILRRELENTGVKL